MFGRLYHHAQLIGAPLVPAYGYAKRPYLLNNADYWLGYSFLAPPGGATLNKVLVYASAVNGTLTNDKLECHVFSDSNGVPNSSLSSTATVTAKPSGAAWVEFTGLSEVLTGGEQYWVVVKNIEASPATNYPTLQAIGYAAQFLYNTLGPMQVVLTQNAGTAWATDERLCTGGMRLEFSDGSFSGLPISDSDTSSYSHIIYGNREWGARFTTPSTGQLVVSGAAASVRIQGSPGNGIQFRLYKNTTLVDTTKQVLVGRIQSTMHPYAMFTASRVLDVDTEYRIVVSHTGAAGDTSNYYGLSYTRLHDSAASVALTALGGWTGTYTTDATASPPSFTDTDTMIPNIALILDGDGIISASGGGGGGGPLIGGRLVR